MMHTLLQLQIIFTCGWLIAALDIDGEWSPWSNLPTKCSKSCGGGESKRFRTCSNPTPEGNGKKCEGKSEEVVPCNTHPCADSGKVVELVEWSEWSNCSADCARGTRKRVMLCGTDKKICESTQRNEETEDCNSWNRTTCESPCEGYSCPEYANCIDLSTDIDPKADCECTMGYVMKEDGSACIRPQPSSPTPRPIPTLPPEQKMVAVVLTRTASTVLLIFVGLTLLLFLIFGIFTPDRVIQMNMEIALALSHILLLMPADIFEYRELCRIVSALLHLFFTTAFMFLFLEALHMYSMVAYVVRQGGMFSRFQNVIVGWGIPLFLVLFTLCFEYKSYGSGGYMCWLMMNNNLVYAQFVPVIVMVVLTFTLIEAAGAADNKPLPGTDENQRTSAKISQRTSLIIVPLTLASWIIGMLSEYQQNLPLYGTFSLLNSILGIAIFFFHTTANEKVRGKLQHCYSTVMKKKKFR